MSKQQATVTNQTVRNGSMNLYIIEHNMEDQPGKSLNSLQFGHGTRFGKRGIVRIKLSDKDLVLIAGIVVAVIIALTTFLLDSGLHQQENIQQAKPKINLPSPAVLINKIGKGFMQGSAR